MNLVFLKKSRKKPQVGDVFVFQLVFEPEQYRFGMVVSTTMRIVNIEDVYLVYIYDHLGNTKADLPDFASKKLLIPPEGINKLGWSSGLFETVAHLDLEKYPEYKFMQHHFRFYMPGVYFDEFYNEIKIPVEPIGIYGLGNYRTIEDKVCRKLGYPLAKD